MPRYALLRHECPPTHRTGSHWDLLLEHEGVLLTWSLDQLPGAWGGDPSSNEVTAERLDDHRLAYLDYQGPVSGDRGDVRRVASGEFAWLVNHADSVAFKFVSGPFTGRLECVRHGADWRLRVIAPIEQE